MNVLTKLNKGLSIASKSFSLLWKNKKLLIYLGFPILAGVLIEILAYNIHIDISSFGISLSHKNIITRTLKMTNSYNWMNYISIIFIYFIYLFIVTFENIALTNHTSIIAQKNKIRILQVLQKSLCKIKIAFVWSVFVLIPITTFYIINMYIQKIELPIFRILFTLTTFILFATWSIVTSFMIPIITFEKINIFKSIKQSTNIIKSIPFEYLGNIFWISLIALLSATPFILLEKQIKTTYIISIPAILLISCIISTAHTISKTLLYKKFKQIERN